MAVNVLEAALWAGQWTPVFPVLENKRPACPGGFKLAKRSPAEIRALWGLYWGPLVGMPTGEPSGISVLDIDVRKGGQEWLTVHGEGLGVTRVHQTRSGGWHLLYRHRKGLRNSASRIAPGIDTRGSGGFVVLWNLEGLGVWNEGVLAEWPEWLLPLLAPKVRPPPPAPVSQVEANARAAALVASAVERVRTAKPGKRHDTLRAACRTIGGLARFVATPEADVRRYLVDLAMAAGGEDRDNAERTAQWGMDWGRAHPLLTPGGSPFTALDGVGTGAGAP